MGVLRDSASRPIDAMHTLAPVALFDACAAAGVRRVVQISALGVEGSATRYASTKRAADEHLLALTAAGRLQGSVVRPAWCSARAAPAARCSWPWRGCRRCCCRAPVQQARVQPVAVRDLAEAVARLATQAGPMGLTEIGGPCHCRWPR